MSGNPKLKSIHDLNSEEVSALALDLAGYIQMRAPSDALCLMVITDGKGRLSMATNVDDAGIVKVCEQAIARIRDKMEGKDVAEEKVVEPGHAG